MSLDINTRKCWDCGNVALHETAVVPHVLCKKCGSQDTRRIGKSDLVQVSFTASIEDDETNRSEMKIFSKLEQLSKCWPPEELHEMEEFIEVNKRYRVTLIIEELK